VGAHDEELHQNETKLVVSFLYKTKGCPGELGSEPGVNVMILIICSQKKIEKKFQLLFGH
jgi:hypothetical protein